MKNKKILIVDDSANIRKLVKVIVKKVGNFEFLEADNGKDGLDLALKHKPDLAILDMIMPGIDGIELCKRIKAAQEIPVIFLTSETTYEAVRQAKEAGAEIFIGKPFEPDDLRTSVKELLA
jgi:CheY-like chemotaxis protein